MTAKRLTRKFLKVTSIIMGVIFVLLACFHWWFINHAEEIVEDLVHARSNGKVNLKVKNFKFNWFSRKMELHQAVFYSTDTLTAPASYRFAIRRLKIQVQSVWPLIMDKKFYIDSLHLYDPKITVTRTSAARDGTDDADSSLSVPQEMGRIYNSIQDALQVLKVDRFQIDNGQFTLINRSRQAEQPVQITNIDFHLENLRVDSTTESGREKILFSDNVALQTHNQDIIFPDGRHRLSFSNFRINIRNRMAEFDSCTVTASKGDSSKVSFKIFFDKLRMTNIDFDTLYHAEVIKADSVYCINPRFRLDVDLDKRSGPVSPPRLDELIQQLTGDMQVAFVIVQDGSFDINTMRDGRPSSFTSDHNNFELRGLRIDQKAARPLMVDRFAMAIRNYETFIRDSAYSIQFDSILINNNRISLSNFTYHELTNNNVVNTVRMPQFELYGLSWDNLVFDQQLKADRVTLYRPIIDYDFNKKPSAKKQDIFAVLGGIGQALQLNNLSVVDGQVNLLFSNKAKVKLQNTSMLIQGEQLVASRKLSGIRRSVKSLHVEKGLFTNGDVTADMHDITFTGSNNQLRAGSLFIKKNNSIDIAVQDAAINSMIWEDRPARFVIDGLSWSTAKINIDTLSKSQSTETPYIAIAGLNGGPTQLNLRNGKMKLKALLENVTADQFVLGPEPQITGLKVAGRDIQAGSAVATISTERINFSDNQQSSLTGAVFQFNQDNDSISVLAPQVEFVPALSQWMHGKFDVSMLKLVKPVVKMKLTKKEESIPARQTFPALRLGTLEIIEPSLAINITSEKGTSAFTWTTQPGNHITAQNIVTSATTDSRLTTEKLNFQLNKFQFSSAKGKVFDSREGSVTARLNQIQVAQGESGNWDWQGTIADLSARDFLIDSIGKRAGRLDIQSARLHDLSVISSQLLNLPGLVKKNVRFRIDEITGTYRDSMHDMAWHNMLYDRAEKKLRMDSFRYNPTKSFDAFRAAQRYQADYIYGHTGAIEAGPFDLEKLVRDSVIDIGRLQVDNAYVNAYRDKRIPREPGIVRPLLVDMIRKIPFKLDAHTVEVRNFFAEYAEVHEKTGRSGHVTVEALDGTINHLRNYDLKAGDSLRIQAHGMLAGGIPTSLLVRESYMDTLGGFLMNVEMGKSDLAVLNPILGALAGAEVQTGLLDTLSMVVAGREEVAMGTMEMRYNSLKVVLLKKDKKGNDIRKNGVLGFLVNTLVKNKNTDRSGTVFFRRLKDRSAINYLVKITMSGVISSVGINKTKKEARAFRRRAKK